MDYSHSQSPHGSYPVNGDVDENNNGNKLSAADETSLDLIASLLDSEGMSVMSLLTPEVADATDAAALPEDLIPAVKANDQMMVVHGALEEFIGSACSDDSPSVSAPSANRGTNQQHHHQEHSSWAPSSFNFSGTSL